MKIFRNPYVARVFQADGSYATITINTKGAFFTPILALLHEFGHLVDLLPTDEGDQDGKSVQNTGEVLRFCRAEIESKVKRTTLSAMR